MIPGEIIIKKAEAITCNKGRDNILLKVKNTGDRPVQIGSHFHFFEVNRKLSFDRAKAFGRRLNIPASTAVRFEPGEEKEVSLVVYGGRRTFSGANDLTNGSLTDPAVKKRALDKAKKEGFMGA